MCTTHGIVVNILTTSFGFSLCTEGVVNVLVTGGSAASSSSPSSFLVCFPSVVNSVTWKVRVVRTTQHWWPQMDLCPHVTPFAENDGHLNPE